MDFGNILKKLRQDNNLTQEELAKKINSSRSNIANYENGKNKPSVEILEKLAKILSCSIDYLMGNSNFRTKEEELNDYLDNEIKITIWKAIDSNYYEYVVPCELKEEDINRLIDIFLPFNKEDSELYAYKMRDNLKKFLDSFEEDKKKEVKKLISIILDDIVQVCTRRTKYHYLKNSIDDISTPSKDTSTQYYMAPVYGQISAGQPNWAEECIEGRLPLDTDLMGIVNPEEHFFLRVNGESMNKVIKNGAFALIHKQDLVDDGDIAVVLVNGYDATLKKFTRQGEFVILEPQSNDESFKSQVYDKTTPIKIIGKYVGKMEFN